MLALFGTPSGGELLLVMLVVLLLFGAKNLPRMARTLGRTMEEFRRAAREVTDEIVHADDQELRRPRTLLKAENKPEKSKAEKESEVSDAAVDESADSSSSRTGTSA